MELYPYVPFSAVPPGETLAEHIEEERLTNLHAADALGLSPDDVRRLIGGELKIDDRLAGRLERFTGVKARMWLTLEEDYREMLERLSD